MSERKGKIQTVFGLIDPSDLGVTLTHEHVSMGFKFMFVNPPEGDEDKARADFTLENSGWIHQHPYSHHDNLILTDEQQAMIEELKTFKKNGGSCIVENSTSGLGRNIQFLAEASRQSGIHIIAGGGYYIEASLSQDVCQMSISDLADSIRGQFNEGIEDTGIKLGMIGEIGCSWPLTDVEKKVLGASAIVGVELGVGVAVHPGRHHDAPKEIVRCLQEHGGDLSKTVMCHLDRTFHKDKDLLDFARLGTYLEYDLFGIEKALYQTNPDVHMPNDGERIRRIQLLCNHGYLDRILIAHDIHTKHRLVKYGGHGFSHISRVVVPMMERVGFTKEMIHQILVENPRKLLTFTK